MTKRIEESAIERGRELAKLDESQMGAQLHVVDPQSGEVVFLDAPVEALGDYLKSVREFESLLKEAKALVNAEVVARMDKAACWTVHSQGVKLSAPSPAPVEKFDGPALHEALAPMVELNVITVEALDAAVETVVEYKPHLKGLNALRKLGGRVAEIIAEHTSEDEKKRYVRVDAA